MSTHASLPFETMIFGFENIFTSSICSNALMARWKSSTESCPEKPRALRQDMSSALRLNDEPELPLPTPVGVMASIVWLADEEPVVPPVPSELEDDDEDELVTRVP